MSDADDTHPVVIGYVLWVFGFMGLHRFFFGKPITGTLWFLTGGLLLIGWIVDLFLVPGMARQANFRYQPGRLDYTLAWFLLLLLGVFGVHRFYLSKWITGVLYLLTGGLVGVGIIYDLWTLNGQVSAINRRESLIGV
jgi:TM2 domain-containing membrane protein YozV